MVFLATLRQYSWANQKPALGNSLDLGIPGIRGSGSSHGLLDCFFLLFCNMLKHIYIYIHRTGEYWRYNTDSIIYLYIFGDMP